MITLRSVNSCRIINELMTTQFMIATNQMDDKCCKLPQEMLLEILLKLPFRSLFRFRCVSNTFQSLISHASFHPSLVSRSLNSSPFSLIFQWLRHIASHVFHFTGIVTNNLIPPTPGLRVEATSNDLVLYRSKSSYFVSNPFTRQCVRIPTRGRRRSCGYAGLISSVRDGMMFTSYTIVRLVKDDENAVDLEMFCSDEGEWRDIKQSNFDSNVEFDERAPCIACRGVLYWSCNQKKTLLAYDPSSDHSWLVGIPKKVYYSHGMNSVLGVSCERFYKLEMRGISMEEWRFPGWKMWVLEDCKTGEWRVEWEAKEAEIVAFSVLSTHSPLFVLALHPWNKDVAYLGYEGYVLTFNLKKGCFQDNVCLFSDNNKVGNWEIFPLLMPLCSTRI